MLEQKDEQEKHSKFKKYLKRFGIGGIIFFTLKGIAWLFIFYFGAEMLESCN